MEPYKTQFVVDDLAIDCFGRLKPSMILYYMQEVAASHFEALEKRALSETSLFWAVSRHRVQITRLPRLDETVTVETWPMPTTRVAYPRAVCIRDEAGNVLVQAVSLWVLMDKASRAMVLPDKSGVHVEGVLLGSELPPPKSLLPKELSNHMQRPVTYSVLDQNGHMNNTRYLDWVEDLLDSSFHGAHTLREFTLCYLSEARENQLLDLHWGVDETGLLQVDAHRQRTDVHGKTERVFCARLQYE